MDESQREIFVRTKRLKDAEKADNVEDDSEKENDKNSEKDSDNEDFLQ